MGDNSSPPLSPPLPKGTYNFNFDDFDENTNPFQASKSFGSSPDKSQNNSNPFQTSTKLSSSPPINTGKGKLNNNDNFEEVDDPFKSTSKLGSSPPLVSNPADDGNGAVHDSNNDDSFKSAVESPPKVVKAKGLKKKAKAKTAEPPQTEEPHTDTVTDGAAVETQNQDGGAEAAESSPAPQQKKKAAGSPKKGGGKKPRAKSKFKPPPTFGLKATDGDIVILEPPCKEPKPEEEDIQIVDPPPPAKEEELVPAADNDDNLEAESKPKEPISVESGSDLPNQIPALDGVDPPMTESLYDFGAGEMPVEANEGFVPKSEVFNEDGAAWDMLENIAAEEGHENTRDSLYTKFDPLVQDQVPDKVLPRRTSDTDLTQNCNEENLMLMNTPPSVKSSASSRGGGQSKHPAARALQDQVEGDGAPREAQTIDKILFSPGKQLDHDEVYFDAREYPPNSLPESRRVSKQGESDVERMNMANVKKHGTSGDNQDSIVQLVQGDSTGRPEQVLKYSQSDWNRMKQDLDLEFNARILNKEKEWSKKLADRDKKISHLDEQTLLLRSTNEDMRLVMAEFEKTISQLQADKVKSTSETQQSYEETLKERDQALDDLQSVETAFSELHQRYERTKGVVEGLKKNEDILKKCVQDYQVKLKAAEDKVIAIRQHAEDKLVLASQEMEKVRRTTTSEVARLEAALKKSELKIQGLERNLDQKVTENEELTAICDELIAKVGGD